MPRRPEQRSLRAAHLGWGPPRTPPLPFLLALLLLGTPFTLSSRIASAQAEPPPPAKLQPDGKTLPRKVAPRAPQNATPPPAAKSQPARNVALPSSKPPPALPQNTTDAPAGKAADAKKTMSPPPADHGAKDGAPAAGGAKAGSGPAPSGERPFVDRDGDGISDGLERRFRRVNRAQGQGHEEQRSHRRERAGAGGPGGGDASESGPGGRP